jgi:hypothetical protein
VPLSARQCPCPNAQPTQPGTDSFSGSLCRFCGRLQHLDLSGCDAILDSDFAHLSGLTALQHLFLSECYQCTDSKVEPTYVASLLFSTSA